MKRILIIVLILMAINIFGSSKAILIEKDETVITTEQNIETVIEFKENVVDFVIDDPESWEINLVSKFAWIKPNRDEKISVCYFNTKDKTYKVILKVEKEKPRGIIKQEKEFKFTKIKKDIVFSVQGGTTKYSKDSHLNFNSRFAAAFVKSGLLYQLSGMVDITKNKKQYIYNLGFGTEGDRIGAAIFLDGILFKLEDFDLTHHMQLRPTVRYKFGNLNLYAYYAFHLTGLKYAGMDDLVDGEWKSYYVKSLNNFGLAIETAILDKVYFLGKGMFAQNKAFSFSIGGKIKLLNNIYLYAEYSHTDLGDNRIINTYNYDTMNTYRIGITVDLSQIGLSNINRRLIYPIEKPLLAVEKGDLYEAEDRNKFFIYAIAHDGGTITPEGKIEVIKNSDKSFSIMPDENFDIATIKVDGKVVNTQDEYEFKNIQGNHVIEVFFKKKELTLNIQVYNNEGGRVEPSGIVIVEYGSTKKVRIFPNDNYVVDRVILDGINIGDNIKEYEFKNIIEDHTLYVYFRLKEKIIIATSTDGGNLDPEGKIRIKYGEKVVFKINPNTGWYLSELLVDSLNKRGELIGNVYTFQNVKSSHTIHAVFKINEPNNITITSIAGKGGSIDPLGNILVKYKEDQRFIITPDKGYKIASVFVDGVDYGVIDSYTFEKCIKDHTIIASFAESSSVVYYTIKASVNGSGGNITPEGDVQVMAGSNISFSINPDSGYEVSSVLVDTVQQGAINSYTFANVNADHEIEVSFIPTTTQQYTITAGVNGSGGTITPVGDTMINAGSNITYNITPNSGYSSQSVLVDNVDQGAITSYTFTDVQENHSIICSFSLAPVVQHTITANVNGTGGTISPAGNVLLVTGNDQTFSMNPNNGYEISSVLVDGINIGTPNTHTFSNVNTNHTIEVSFTPTVTQQYTITASVNGTGGIITPVGDINVNAGSNITFSINPQSGYEIESVVVDGVDQGILSSYTFTNVQSSHTIECSFAETTVDQHTITATAGVGGSISPFGEVVVNEDDDQSFVIIPDNNYNIQSLYVDGVDQGAISSYLFQDVETDHTISATFSLKTYSITASSGPNGSISPSGTIQVSHGNAQIFNFNPDPGYEVDYINVDGAIIYPTGNSYTFLNVQDNHFIIVSYKVIEYTITASVNGSGGTIDPIGDVVLQEGGSQTFTINNNVGWEIESVLVDGVDQGAIGSYTFNNITTNHTIVAQFRRLQYTVTVRMTGEVSHGNISPLGNVTVYHGDDLVLNGTYDGGSGGYGCKLFVNGTRHDYRHWGNSATWTISNITSDINVEYWIGRHWGITATSGPNGSISHEGYPALWVFDGDGATLFISADPGYVIDQVLVNGVGQGPISSYHWSSVHSDQTIYATFRTP